MRPRVTNVINLDAIVTKRNGNVAGSPEEGLASEITYNVMSIDPRVAQIRLENQTPVRRVANNVIVVVAQPYDPCLIQILSGLDEYRVFVTEGIAFSEACPP